ncbi:UNVERIFIED_CONTAM: hypothetical protein K2H54_068106 [Gekko kuhli]
MNRGSSAASCPPSLPADGHDSRSECRRVCSNCRKVLRQVIASHPYFLHFYICHVLGSKGSSKSQNKSQGTDKIVILFSLYILIQG